MSLGNNRELARKTYIWDIRNFASLALLADRSVLFGSPMFKARSLEEACKFYIYPKGNYDEDFVGFYFYIKKISRLKEYNFILSIGKPDARPSKAYTFYGAIFTGGCIGEEFFLRKKLNRWILKGPVRFRCDITKTLPRNIDFAHVFFNSYNNINLIDKENLSQDLLELLNLPFHSDLTVNMNGSETYIHKYMLFARCPNICFEFQYNSIMEMPPFVETEIDDEIFELLMHYIYTGKLRDSYVPLELFHYAERLGVSSLLQCVHEQAIRYHVYSEVETEEKIINWNLDELEFLEEDSTCVYCFRTKLFAAQLAIQVSISSGSKEKFLDVSFKFFGLRSNRSVLLISKISLTSQAGFDDFKEERHVFLEDEKWNFPRLLYKKDECTNSLGMLLTAELSMSDKSNLGKVRGVKTKTKLYTEFQTVTDNLENLASCMDFLFRMFTTSNLVLLSADNKTFRVHNGIMWARWPGLRNLIDRNSVSSEEELADTVHQLELELPSEVLNILLPYLYTGFIANFDRAKAEMLLNYRNYLEYPDHLVRNCLALLPVNPENQLSNLFTVG